jgi:cytochrome c-type biogenesis protein CcmH
VVYGRCGGHVGGVQTTSRHPQCPVPVVVGPPRMSSRIANGLAAGVIIALLTLVLTSLLGAEATPEDRAYALEQRLRCPVCKSVSIAESPSETAASMRRVVAEQVAAGRSDEEVIGYFEDRYGGWVLLDPPMSGETRWLWLLSVGAGLTGLLVILLRAGREAPEPITFSETEREQLAIAMGDYRLRHTQDDEP